MNTQKSFVNKTLTVGFLLLGLILPAVIFAADAPTVITHPAAGITETEAVLSGELTSAGGSSNTTVWFVYGLTSSYGYQTNSETANTVGTMNAHLSGLTACALYHFKAYGRNEAGTVSGSNQTFTTLCPSGSLFIRANNIDDQLTVNYNQAVIISWLASNALSCAASGDWSGSKPLSGTWSTDNLTSNKTYTITCSVPGSASISDTVRVNVGSSPNLSVVLEAVPTSGRAPLQNVDLKATLSGTASGSARYQFDCQNDGTYEKDITVSQDPYSPYIAFNLCNYPNTGSFTARVRATRDNQTAENTTVIQVGQVNNLGPTANAGPDRQISNNQTTILQGSGADPNGDTLTYFWNCNGGSLNNYNIAQPTFTPPSNQSGANYACALTVTDPSGLAGSDGVIISVNQQTASPDVETQNATNIQNNQATLNGYLRNLGGGSYATVWFQWGTNTTYGNTTPSQPLYNTGNFNYTITNLNQNTAYYFRAVAQNNQGLVYGQNLIFNTNGSQSSLPWANAGPDKQAYEGGSVVLQGSGGDSAGGYVTYSWNCNGGSLNNYNIAQPTFLAPQIAGNANYTCYLAVSNNSGLSNSDAAVITVTDNVSSQAVLTVTKTVQNISRGDGLWLDTVSANPGDDVIFGIVIKNNGQDTIRNLYFKDTLPVRLTYQNQFLIDSVIDNRVPTLQAISIGDLAPGATRTLGFRAKVDPAASFGYGATTLINTALAYNDQTSLTDTASVVVNRTAVAGASTITFVNTGLVDDLFNSLLLPLLAAGLLVFVFRSQVIGLDRWMDKRKQVTGEYKAQKKLNKLVKGLKNSN